jgi:hypothetical protein
MRTKFYFQMKKLQNFERILYFSWFDFIQFVFYEWGCVMRLDRVGIYCIQLSDTPIQPHPHPHPHTHQ